MKVKFDSSKKHPPYGGYSPPPPSPNIKTKVRWLRMTVEKNPALIAFFKLFLGDLKSTFCEFSGHFLMDFWMRSLHRPIIDVRSFSKMKGVEVVHISDKFHLNLACGS